MKFISALNAVGENAWAAFIMLAGLGLAALSIRHPDLKDAATMVIGGALAMFRTTASSSQAATAVTAVTVTPPKL